VAMVSADGSTMIAGTPSGTGTGPNGLFKSINNGSSWTDITPSGVVNKSWFAGGISSDGQTIVAGIFNGRMYRTTNGGTDWTEIQPAGNIDRQWDSIGVSRDGQVIVAGEYDDGNLYLSTDGGDAWTTPTIPSSDATRYWNAVGVSGDGRTLLAGANNNNAGPDRLYLGSSPPTPTPTPTATLTPTPTSVPTTAPVTNNSSSSQTSSSSNVNAAPALCQDSSPHTAPTLSQITASKGSVTIYFVPIQGQNISYYVSYGFDSSAEGFGTSFSYPNSSGMIAYKINALFPGTWYFKVRGQNGCQPGNWSGVKSVRVTSIGSSYSDATNRRTVTKKQTTKNVCIEYIVKPGDTLWSIAASQLGNASLFSTIIKQNKLKSSSLHTRQKLKLNC